MKRPTLTIILLFGGLILLFGYNSLGSLNPDDLNILGCGNFGNTSTSTICGNGGGTATSSLLSGLTVNGSSFVVVGSNGRVGIGTANPVNPLHLFSPTNNITQRIEAIDPTGSANLNLTGEDGNSFMALRWVNSGATQTNLISVPSSGVIRVGNSGSGGLILVNQSVTGPIIFATGGFPPGNERVRINSTGAVGIGTTSPGALLSVSGSSGLMLTNTGTGNTFYVEDAANDTTPFVIDASGNVGIGTTTPADLLSIGASDATTTLHLGAGSATQGSCIQMYSPNGTSYRLYVSNGGALTTESGDCN